MPRRASIEFVPCSDPQNLDLRFGGEPFGLARERWPMSRGTGEAMQFICQIPVRPELFPVVAESVAYLFMTQSERADGTWLPDSGENAVIIVPREQLTGSLTVGDAPRLARMVKKWWSKNLIPQNCAYSARLTMTDDPPFIPETTRFQMAQAEDAAYREALVGNKIGGTPGFLQGGELPFPEPWHLLLQLDSTRVPFWINFGDAGVGYAFLNGTGTEGKLLWQCC